MTDGKNAVGLRGFPTPNTAAGIAGYLLLLFDDKEWAQWVLGALEPLAYAYNFYESGDLSPDEAAEAFRLIVQDAPYNTRTCPNPAGGKMYRIAPNGHVEEYGDAGEWQDPTGDATIPSVPARTDGTPPDQICLASKNAARVLELLYENVSDSFSDGLSAAAAGVALIEAMSLIVGSEFAPITFAIVSVSAAIFGAFYAIMEFATADLWDADFTKQLTCILQECASNEDGVVTFDWDCFLTALAAQVNIFDLTFSQLRLFGQIQYLLFMVGGVDALNLAGATTEITDDDCSFCDAVWCRNIQGDSGLGDWEPHTFSGQNIAIFDGTEWAAAGPVSSALWLSWEFSPNTTLTDASILTYFDNGGNAEIRVNGDGSDPFQGTQIWANGAVVGTPFPISVSRIDASVIRAFNSATVTMGEMQFSGTGDNPFGDDNC